MSATTSLRKLEAAGFTREQAEAILESQAGPAATRADLSELRADMPKVAIGIVIAALTFAIVRVLIGN